MHGSASYGGNGVSGGDHGDDARSVDQPGTYSVTVTDNDNGCTDEASIMVMAQDDR